MSKRSTFRPTVQTLETRRCMAAAVLADAPVVEEEKPAVTQGWGMAQYQYGFEGTYHDSAGNGSDELKRAKDPTTATDDVIVDGNIITAENYDASIPDPPNLADGTVIDPAANRDATDAFFSELGDDDTASAATYEEIGVVFHTIPWTH